MINPARKVHRGKKKQPGGATVDARDNVLGQDELGLGVANFEVLFHLGGETGVLGIVGAGHPQLIHRFGSFKKGNLSLR